MVSARAARGGVTKVSVVVGLNLGLLVVAALAPAHVVEVVTAISPSEARDRARLDALIQGAIDEVVAHAVAFTPAVVALIGARIIGDRIFLFVLLADRDGEQAIRTFSGGRPHSTGLTSETEDWSKRPARR